jgi:dTDP-4-amino-4,6-dideoxygalactose transaminase
MNDISSTPFLDMITPHLEYEEEFIAIFRKALGTGRFIGGPMVKDFERDFAGFCGTKYCIGVGSGTDALRFALIAAGIKHGEIVITVPNTFIATTEAITQAGAVHQFVDINEQTYNINIEKLREYLEEQCHIDTKTGKPIDRRTKKYVSAIIPVHLYGQMADMDPIMELAGKYNLTVIEDACQAHGAEYFSKKENEWRRAGSMGHVSAFSFYPGKNLGAFGEAGAVTTNNEYIAKRVRMLRDHGQSEKYYHDIEGYNGRLDAIQAGVLGIKLKYLTKWNEKRRANAIRYNKLLSGAKDIITPYEPSWSKAVYHLYIIRIQNRDSLQNHLTENRISTGLHYPVPLHLQKAYAGMDYKQGNLQVTEKVSKEILSLPMFPDITETQQNHVVKTINKFVGTMSNNYPLSSPLNLSLSSI